MGKISIITINYNNKTGLEKTIGSVLSQKGVDFEYVVIDGNSKDGSREVVEQYKSQVAYALSEPDTGIYNAMNKGIRAATGDYLLFLNSGDTLLEQDTLAKAAALIDGQYDFYYGNQIYLSNRSNQIEHWIAPEQVSLGFFVDNSLPHQATFIRRTLFEKFGMYNENLKIASDWEFFTVAICLHKASYKHIGMVVADYDFTGISSNPDSYNLVQSEKKIVMERYFGMNAEEFDLMSEMKLKRVRNLLYIKKFRWPWKLLKGFSNILLAFLPKPNKR
ncbi:glycosyltransferase family 2 protein [Flavobacterium caeni]|uniref:Glycosyltransferase involved in cell wall bisynthesis n=1 Tax=Flavobacterium caeni TaxID=490189 RepID=A0A1G5AVT9_9FLAO|nr:glycosyltransferase family 2 protein [Flavobacterium caeni]SCX81973.1 Glycosyltransferase involved in cell wall bisynthesis [Flavobacterium caeni]